MSYYGLCGLISKLCSSCSIVSSVSGIKKAIQPVQILLSIQFTTKTRNIWRKFWLEFYLNN